MASSSSSRSPEIRKDSIFNKWVIFSPARSRRPSDFKSHSQTQSNNSSSSSYSPSCPFCARNEHDCAPEIFRIPTQYDSDSWKIRVVQNLYPALLRPANPDLNPNPDSNPNPNLNSNSPYSDCVLSGIGFHEVVIETPDHALRLSDLSPTDIASVFLAHKHRIEQLDNGFIKYIQVFKNHGASAGASLSHSHSQLMGLPFIPPTVSARLDSMKEHFSRTGKCGLCEIRAEEILVNESAHFFSIVPFAASYPFEIWVIPRVHSPYFHELDDEKAIDLGGLLKVMLMKLSQQLNDPPFNFMIHTSPFQVTAANLSYAHWFVQIVPQLTGIGGFEMGSGCYINPVFPEDAAKVLREVNLTI